MFIGIDLGTSGVKAVLLDRDDRVRVTATRSLTVQRPHPRWSEQAPEDWWQATLGAIDDLLAQSKAQGIASREIDAIGLSGQMHGATLLDADDHVLRPAILWNDGRCDVECSELEADFPQMRRITGNMVLPGFTAPKLAWVRRHEPSVFERIHRVLLPKDYLRLRLSSGAAISDPSDAAGTLWLDVATRDWNDELLAATGLTRAQMPSVNEGPVAGAMLSGELAGRFGLREIPIAAGGGDNAAGAVGVGVVKPGQAMLSLGTSGVYFVVADGFRANPAQAVHSFCHALPDTWHLMSVMLNAASCLDVAARLGGHADVASMLAEAEALRPSNAHALPHFLPYLGGERTPHNDVRAKGVFFGLVPDTARAEMTLSVLEGVGLALLDGIDAVHAAGVSPEAIDVIGGGSRSALWMQMLADISGRPLTQRLGGEVGPALGAARLARLAAEPQAGIADVCPQPPVARVFEPDSKRHAMFRDERRPTFQRLYQVLKPVFHA